MDKGKTTSAKKIVFASAVLGNGDPVK